jgi:hypothetical protein
MGEALGGGGRGAHQWRDGARWSRKRRSSVGKAWDGGCSGVRSGGRHGVNLSGWRRRGVRAGGAGLNGQVGDGGSDGQAGRSGERCGVGRSGGRAAWGRRGEGARGCTWLGWSVRLLSPGDGPLVHHPR